MSGAPDLIYHASPTFICVPRRYQVHIDSESAPKLEWTQHRDGYSENHYTLAVAAYERWGRSNPESVPFAIVLRVEDIGKAAKVYTEIAEVLAELQIQARGRAQ